MKELQFSLKEDYYLPCITNVRHYVADMLGRGRLLGCSYSRV
jgi:hypothetical protein